MLLNTAMVAERSEYLGARPYERSESRSGYANGFKDKTVKTRLGALPLFPSVPWQRCQFHLQQNAGQYVPSVSMRIPVAGDIRAIFSLPESHRRRLRTTNLIERVNQEVKRRTRVARLFPNEASCWRLVSAVLMEIAEDWQTADKRYVTFSEDNAVEG